MFRNIEFLTAFYCCPEKSVGLIKTGLNVQAGRCLESKTHMGVTPIWAAAPFKKESKMQNTPEFGATLHHDALELLEKAVDKAKVDKDYFNRLESALLRGSTVEGRELFSDFGDYWARTSAVIPYYPHHDAVNSIDTALFHIRIGDMKEAIDDYNFLHNRSLD